MWADMAWLASQQHHDPMLKTLCDSTDKLFNSCVHAPQLLVLTYVRLRLRSSELPRKSCHLAASLVTQSRKAWAWQGS